MFEWLKSRFKPKAAAPPESRVFTPGEAIDLGPGEGANLEFALPIEIQAMLATGEHMLDYIQGPKIDDGNGKYHSDCLLTLDGKPFGRLRLDWEGSGDIKVDP